MFAWALARYGKKLERSLEKHKLRLLSGISGTVLEIGPGAGANLRYYPTHGVKWIGIEPNRFMYPYLEKEADALGFQVELLNGTAESLPFPDLSIDAVVSTLVLCCVSDQRIVLKEVLRVLKPGSKFLFIEHVAAPGGSRLRRLQHWISPVWRRFGDGCHPDRETWVEIDRAGFREVDYEHFDSNVPIITPHIAGVALK